MGEWLLCCRRQARGLSGTIFGGATALAGTAAIVLALVSVDGRIAQAADNLPEVETPDFADVNRVLDSLEAMKESIEEVQENEGWRALRAADQCETAIDIIEDKMTAAAYDAEAGERSWRLCHQRYQSLKLH